MSKAVKKNRAQWAAEICAAHKRSIEGILTMGRTLIAAKRALDYGEFQRMIDHDLPFDASTAQRLMKIARDRRLTEAAHVQLLPMAWGTLYELTKLPDTAFEQALRSGTINPQMTRAQAQTVRVQLSEPRPAYTLPAHFPVTYEPRRVVVPVYVTSDEPDEAAPLLSPVPSATPPADAPPADVGSLALPRAERALVELEMSIKRGEVRDAGRVRLFVERAARLPDLIEAAMTDDQLSAATTSATIARTGLRRGGLVANMPSWLGHVG